MMNRTEIEEKLRLIKFCMKRRIPVEFDGAQYITEALQLRYRAIGAESGFYYSVELSDINRINSSITVGLNDVDWPTEGGGFKLET